MKSSRLVASALLACLCVGCGTSERQDGAIEVKVVVVTMFEIGSDSGDTAGEFQFWYERAKLKDRLPFAHAHDLYLNRKTGVLGMVTGEGTANSASAVMQLGLDPRLDLSHAYWLIAGVSGVDPEDASVGSAAWAEYVVDGDLAQEIDAREIPSDWPTGYLALDTDRPYESNKPKTTSESFRLNPALVDWAYQTTRAVELQDNAVLEKERAAYVGFPNAQKPPFVLKGDDLASSTYWHGKLLNDWANRWVKYWTDGKGNFVTSAMEDNGSIQALTYLDRTGKVNKDRVMVLRTASNYTMQPPGMTAAEHSGAPRWRTRRGSPPRSTAAYRVGARSW